MFAIPSDIYFIGGFGTVAWVNVKDYEAILPDKIAVDGGERNLKVGFHEFFLGDSGFLVHYFLRVRGVLISRAAFFPFDKQELNAIFSKPLRKVLSLDGEIDDAALISIDSKGTDIRVRQGAQVPETCSFHAL